MRNKMEAITQTTIGLIFLGLLILGLSIWTVIAVKKYNSSHNAPRRNKNDRY